MAATYRKGDRVMSAVFGCAQTLAVIAGVMAFGLACAYCF